MKPKVCVCCDSEFTPGKRNYKRAVTCSSRCNLKKWRADNPERSRQIKRDWRRKNGVLEAGSPAHRQLVSDWMQGRYVGEKHPRWKGVTSKNKLARASKAYKDWRLAVFERDDYTCQFCGIRGGYLEADHIMPFAFYPELRFTISNGRTLCQPCHATTPTYKKQKDVVCQ